MAPAAGADQRWPHAHLEAPEISLVELAASFPADKSSFSEKETEILELYDRLYEQQLEKALLTQDQVEIGQVDDVKEQLAKAERELLEARASCSLQRKAIEAVLMTDPAIQSIHSTDKTVIERSLLPLVNRRDLLSLIYENLARAHSACRERLSNAEVENMKLIEENKELVRSLFELTTPQEKTGKDLITDPNLKEQVEELEAEHKQKKAEWGTIKRIVSASIVASGIDWASDEKLRELVMAKSAEDG